eukprot:483132_1
MNVNDFLGTSIQYSEREIFRLEEEYARRKEHEVAELIESGFLDSDYDGSSGEYTSSDSEYDDNLSSDSTNVHKTNAVHTKQPNSVGNGFALDHVFDTQQQNKNYETEWAENIRFVYNSLSNIRVRALLIIIIGLMLSKINVILPQQQVSCNGNYYCDKSTRFFLLKSAEYFNEKQQDERLNTDIDTRHVDRSYHVISVWHIIKRTYLYQMDDLAPYESIDFISILITINAINSNSC